MSHRLLPPIVAAATCFLLSFALLPDAHAQNQRPQLSVQIGALSTTLDIPASQAAQQITVQVPTLKGITNATVSLNQASTTTSLSAGASTLTSKQLPGLGLTTVVLSPIAVDLSVQRLDDDCLRPQKLLLFRDEPQAPSFGVKVCARADIAGAQVALGNNVGITATLLPAASGEQSGVKHATCNVSSLALDSLTWRATQLTLEQDLKFWPRPTALARADRDVNDLSLTNPTDQKALIRLALAQLAVTLPTGWSQGDAPFINPAARDQAGFGIIVYANGGITSAQPLWAPDATNSRRELPTLSSSDETTLTAAIVGELQAGRNAVVELIHSGEAAGSDYPLTRLALRQAYAFQSAELRDANGEKIKSYDVNFSIASVAKYVCVLPVGNAPTAFRIQGSRLELLDSTKRRLLVFSPKQIEFTRPSGNFWCAPIHVEDFQGGFVAQATVLNNGRSSNKLYLADDGRQIGTEMITPRVGSANAGKDALRLSYIALGPSRPLCDDCRRSFLPNAALTVRAALPLLNLSAGVPSIVSARWDLGLSPAMVLGDSSGKTVAAAGLGVFSGVCGAIETTASPKVCLVASLDALFTSNPHDTNGVGSPAAAIQPNAMVLVGASAP